MPLRLGIGTETGKSMFDGTGAGVGSGGAGKGGTGEGCSVCACTNIMPKTNEMIVRVNTRAVIMRVPPGI